MTLRDLLLQFEGINEKELEEEDRRAIQGERFADGFHIEILIDQLSSDIED